MLARADVRTHAYTPHKRAVKLIPVKIAYARISALRRVTDNAVPFKNELIFAVTVKIAYSYLTRAVCAFIIRNTLNGSRGGRITELDLIISVPDGHFITFVKLKSV